VDLGQDPSQLWGVVRCLGFQIRALSAIGAIVHVLLEMQNASFRHTESKETLEARWAFVIGKTRWVEKHEI
jgi:hypothetical protein